MFLDGPGYTRNRGIAVYLLTVETRGKGGKTAFMRVWSIGKTLASQAKKAGSIPAIRSKQLNMEQEERPSAISEHQERCCVVAGGLFVFLRVGGEDIARKRTVKAGEAKDITWDAGEANAKQMLFYQSRVTYTAYGGAKGGGKTHAVRIKAVGGAIANAGIKILIMRRTYPELEENHIRPLTKMVPPQLASYNATTHLMTFQNGSTIKFGHWSGDQSEDEYNGLEYDWIFIDEATQFSERSFNFLGGCLRGVNAFPKRMYLTCNPGGVGHRWVKRLFIDKQYKVNPDNPEENENPEDYLFIPATVEDNYHLMESSPGYVRMLANMPEDKRRAYRYGDWSAIGGNYFPEFSSATHVVAPFKVPDHWQRYRSFDYGLDMFACFWWAVDEDGRSWCIREYCEKNLIVKDAAKKIHEHTLPGENIAVTYCPPDMWNRQKDSGKTMAELFMLNQVGLVKADNNRVQGHMMMKDALAPRPLNDPYVKKMFASEDGTVPERLPGLMFFDVCKNVIGDIQDIQSDEKNPDDCAKDPHDVTHTVDGVRYYAISRVLPAESLQGEEEDWEDEEADEDYDTYMRGGEITAEYLM